MKKNKLLFAKRSKKKKWAPDTWDIVGGHALKNETPFETLARETHEEIGVIVHHAKLLTSLKVFDESIQKYFKYHIYMITCWEGKAFNASKEHTKVRWFTRAELEKHQLSMPVHLELIDDWFKE